MSLSSLESALAAVIIWLARSAVAEPVYPFRIHSTLRGWDKNIMPCQLAIAAN